jgi:SAM-dependent methyltransferase
VTFRVLQSWADNRAARDRLNAQGLGFWPRVAGQTWRRRLQRKAPIQVGELNKSWDVLLCVEEILRRTSPDDTVVDLGAFASEVPCALAQAGYTSTIGIDLNPEVKAMPFADRVRWLCGDMTATGLPSGSVSAVVALSSIEHGDPMPVLQEAARLLRPGGVFVGSTDYWPQKINTDDVTMFGLPWTIFSAEEIEALLARAATLGLETTGPIELDADEACIDCADRLYTFGWFCLQRR